MFTYCETLVLYVILLAVSGTNASLPLCGLCTRQCKHDCSEMEETVTWVSDYSSIIPLPSSIIHNVHTDCFHMLYKVCRNFTCNVLNICGNMC